MMIIRRLLFCFASVAVAPGMVAAETMPAVPPVKSEQPARSEFEQNMDSISEDILGEEKMLTPSQLREFKLLRDAMEKEAVTPVNKPGSPVSRSVQVSLAPGGTPLPIRLESNVVTSLVFTDSTGTPWPIADFSPGAKAMLQLPDREAVISKKMNVLTLAPNRSYVSTNLSVLLDGANAPIVFAVVSNQKKTDYRLDINVQARSSLSPDSTVSGFEAGLSGEMQDILDGTPPDGATELTITGDNSARAWKIGDFFYVRTRMMVTSPAAIVVARSADGTHAFKLPESPLLYAVSGGKFIKLRISGY